MEIVCPMCNARYRISNQRVPRARAVARCKKCGGQISIEPAVAVQTGSIPVIEKSGESTRPPSPGTGDSARMAMLGNYPELRILNPEKFDFGEIFAPDKNGRYRSRKNALKVKILTAVSDVLGKMLRDGEKVMRIGKGVAYYPAEIFFGNGFLTMLYNHYAIVCTNQRVLFLNINSRINRTTHYFFQILYENIKAVKQSLLTGSLILDRVKGKRRIFNYVKRHLGKEVKDFIMARRDHVKGVKLLEEPLENLCPSCFSPLKKDLVSCPNCRKHFKEQEKAFLKSLILPGWGDIYLGHRALGILELVGSIIVWVTIVPFLLSGKVGVMFIPLVFLISYHGLDGLLTYHMAKKGYMLTTD